MKKDRQTKEQRRMAQQIRRNMIQRVKPSGKVYKRKNRSTRPSNELVG